MAWLSQKSWVAGCRIKKAMLQHLVWVFSGHVNLGKTRRGSVKSHFQLAGTGTFSCERSSDLKSSHRAWFEFDYAKKLGRVVCRQKFWFFSSPTRPCVLAYDMIWTNSRQNIGSADRERSSSVPILKEVHMFLRENRLNKERERPWFKKTVNPRIELGFTRPYKPLNT